MTSGPPQTQNPSKSRPVQTKPFTNPNNNPIPGTPEYVAKFGGKTGTYTIGGVTYGANGQPVRTSQIPNTTENRAALDARGIKYNPAGQNIFLNSTDLENAIANRDISVLSGASTAKPETVVGGRVIPNDELSYFRETGRESPSSRDRQAQLDFFSSYRPKIDLSGFSAREPAKNNIILSENLGIKEKPDISGLDSFVNPSAGKGKPIMPAHTYGYEWVSGQVGKTFDRKSAIEERVKQNEADRASSLFISNDEPDYATGGKPVLRSTAGVETPESALLMQQTRGEGFGQRAKGQNIRNTNAERALIGSEANRAMEKEKGENISFTTFNTPSKPNPRAEPHRANLINGQTSTIIDTASERNWLNAKGISYKVIAGGLLVNTKQFQNAQSGASGIGDVFPAKEQSFEDYITSSAKGGGVIDILVNNKVVGEVKGPNALSDILKYESVHPNQQFSVLATYPQREQALTNAVQKEPGTYLKMPKSYWDNLSKGGYLSSNNVNKINNILQLESSIEFRKQVADVRYKAEINYLYEPENEVASFLRIPYSGSKVSTPWGNYTLAGGQKYSTSNIPSTSLANVLQFLPGLGSGLLGKASIELEKLVTRAEPSLLKTGIDFKNKINGPIQRKVLFESPLTNAPKNFKKLPVSTEIEVRNRPTYRSTNPTRTSLPTDIYARDTGEGIRPFSETPSEKLPVNSFNPRTGARARMIGEENAQTTSAYNKMMNDLLKPKPEEPSPNAPRNLPFFPGRTTTSGKPYTGNLSPIRLFNPSRESVANVQTKVAGVAPIRTFTKPDIFVGGKLEGENFQYFYTGNIPKSYLPQASTVYGGITEPVSLEFGYNPASKRNLEYSRYETTRANAPRQKRVNTGLILGNGEIPKEFGSATPDLLGARTNRVRENQQYYLSNLQKGLLNISTKTTPASERLDVYDLFGRGGIKPINQKDIADIRFERADAERKAREESLESILQKTIDIRPKQIVSRPPRPLDIVTPEREGARPRYSAKAPLDIFRSSSPYSQTPTDVREFLGLSGEKVSPTKYGGKAPLEKYGYVSQQGLREGEPAFFNLETGTIKRAFYSKPEATGRTAPLDIWSGEISGKTIYPNAKGAKYYQSASVYDMGKTFVRGSLQTKDVGLIKFEKYQEKHPPEPEIGAKGVWSDLEKSLSKNYRKASIFSTDFKEVKSGKSSSTSANLFKPVEKKPEVKGTEFKNTGSKTETILIRKPLVKKNLITDNTLATDYNFEYARTPPSKEGGTISMTLGTKSGSIFKYGPKLAPGQKSKTGLSEILKSPTRTKELPDLLHGPKLGQDQTPRLTPKQTPKNIPKILQTPKQTSTPKQTPKHTPKTPTPQIPKFPTDISPMFTPANVSRIPPPPPKKGPPPPLPNWGFPFQGKRPKGASGPTGILNLDVHNPFTSSFSIKIKGNRIEF